MKMEQSVPKRRHIKFRRRGITQKEAYNKHSNIYLVIPLFIHMFLACEKKLHFIVDIH